MANVDKRSKGEPKLCKAYFTVEAAIIVPIVMSVLVYVIFMSLFQYNRCLLEQDIGMLILYAVESDEQEGTELKNNLEQKLKDLYWDKYFSWKQEELQVSVKGEKVEIYGMGELQFPFMDWNLAHLNTKWSAQAKREGYRLNPTEYIRLINRLKREIS